MSQIVSNAIYLDYNSHLSFSYLCIKNYKFGTCRDEIVAFVEAEELHEDSILIALCKRMCS